MDDFGGAKHFGVWPLADAAESCFGARNWPAQVPIPQATIEFELENIDAVESGARVLARLLGPEGLLIGLSYAPWLHPKV